MKIVKAILSVLLWALLLVPFFLGAQAAHPATDDFTFAAYTHPTWAETGSILHVLKDAASYTLRTWRDWQGTITGVIIMTLNPIVFSLPHYGVHAAILLALHLLAWLVFTRHIFVRRLGLAAGVWLGMYLALSAISLVYLPDIVEGIYWFNGAWFYTGAQAVALLTLTLCDIAGESGAAKGKKAALWLLCALLLFALGMDNYITAMMTAAALMMMALQRAWAAHRTPAAAMLGRFVYSADGAMTQELRSFGGPQEKEKQKRAARRMLLCLLPIGAGLLISVLAPGNHVRMATDGAHESGMAWLIGSILQTLWAALGYFARFLVKTPLLALLLAATPGLCRAVDRLEERAWRCPPVVVNALCTYLILCAMIIPHMYSSGYAGSGRVVNMYHLYVLLAVPVSYVMMIMRCSSAKRAGMAREKRRYVLLGAAALVVCLLLGQHGNYQKLVSDQHDGTQDAYIAQFENEYALCSQAGEADEVVLPVWTVQTVTGKPTAFADPAMWTNEAMAQYFGVAGVRTGE